MLFRSFKLNQLDQTNAESDTSAQYLAARVFAISGLYEAALSNTALTLDTTIHLVHGRRDHLAHYSLAMQAAENLIARGADITCDVLPTVGHEITAAMVDLCVEKLSGYIPKRIWQAALQAAGESA